MGFKLRSGNGPLQFKQMGSSPAKINVGAIAGMLSTQSETKEFGKNKMNELNASSKVMKDLSSDTDRMKIVSQELKGPSEETQKNIAKDKKSIDKQAKKVKDKSGTWLGRTAKKTGKGLKKAGSWVNKMSEKRAEFQASEEGARFRDDMNRSANIVAGEDRYATDNLEKHKASKKADELHTIKMDNVERNQLETDLMNKKRRLQIDAYEAENNLKLPASTMSHVNSQGKANFASQVNIKDTSASRAFEKTKADFEKWKKKA